MEGNDELCGVAVLVIGMAVLLENDNVAAAKKAWERLNPLIQELTELIILIQGTKKLCPEYYAPEVQLQHVAKNDMKDFDSNRLDSFLEKDGVWIVRLRQKDVSVYVVVVNNKNKLIYDSVEKFSMKLNKAGLDGCGGRILRNVVVHEVRKLVMQRKKRKVVEVVELN